MTWYDIYLEWIILVNSGVKRAEFDLISSSELSRLLEKQSRWIQDANIYIENGKTVIELR